MSAAGSPRYLDFPLALAPGGAVRTTDGDDHVRDLILQVLFTEPGERVNRPDFGCGIKRLLFAPDSDVLRATTRFLITQNLQQWLGDQLDVERVDVSSDADETGGHAVRIEIAYVLHRTHTRGRVEAIL